MSTSAPSRRPAEHDSRTYTITPTPTPGTDPSNPNGEDQPTVRILRLRGGPNRNQKVAWSQETIDNEGMGKKKSKICCIYHRPKAFDESSTGSSSSSDGEIGPPGRGGSGKGKSRQVRRDKQGVGDGSKEVVSSESESEGGTGSGRARPPPKPRRHQHHHNSHCDSEKHPASANRYDHQAKVPHKGKDA